MASVQESSIKQCVVCLDAITTRGRIPVCDHRFCYTCIFEWSKNTNTCPLCKKRFRCITKISDSSPVRKVRISDKDQTEHFDDVLLSHLLDLDSDNEENELESNDSLADFIVATPTSEEATFHSDSESDIVMTPSSENTIRWSTPVVRRRRTRNVLRNSSPVSPPFTRTRSRGQPSLAQPSLPPSPLIRTRSGTYRSPPPPQDRSRLSFSSSLIQNSSRSHESSSLFSPPVTRATRARRNRQLIFSSPPSLSSSPSLPSPPLLRNRARNTTLSSSSSSYITRSRQMVIAQPTTDSTVVQASPPNTSPRLQISPITVESSDSLSLSTSNRYEGANMLRLSLSPDTSIPLRSVDSPLRENRAELPVPSSPPRSPLTRSEYRAPLSTLQLLFRRRKPRELLLMDSDEPTNSNVFEDNSTTCNQTVTSLATPTASPCVSPLFPSSPRCIDETPIKEEESGEEGGAHDNQQRPTSSRNLVLSLSRCPLSSSQETIKEEKEEKGSSELLLCPLISGLRNTPSSPLSPLSWQPNIRKRAKGRISDSSSEEEEAGPLRRRKSQRKLKRFAYSPIKASGWLSSRKPGSTSGSGSRTRKTVTRIKLRRHGNKRDSHDSDTDNPFNY